jgi:capsular polysaccharide transport system permease protein
MNLPIGARAERYRRLLSLNSSPAPALAWPDDRPSLGVRVATALRRLWRDRVLRWTVFFLPTFLTAAYFFVVASDQYESEAQFVVRSAARPEVPGGLAFLVQLGLARSQDDSFIVQEFMTSRDAIEQLRTRLPLEEMFHPEGADFLARYPSLLYGPEGEEFYRYFQRMVSVVHADKTGISTMRVRAFHAADADDIAKMLLIMGEDLINRINQRLQTDAIGNSQAALQTAQARVIEAQAALTEFRNRELIVDPMRNAVALAELIARLSAELGTTQAQIAEMKVGSAASPQLLGLQRKAAALDEQIAAERARIVGDKAGLAARIATYERLTLEREFANRMLSSAEAELVRARAEAARQLLYLERIVEPHLADYATQPKRVGSVLTVAALNVIALLVFWLFRTGVRDHAAE